MSVLVRVLQRLGMAAGLLLVSGMVLSPARAALITYNFTGDVTSVSPLLTSQFNTSQSMSGSLTTNTSVPFNNNIQDFHVTIGTYTATMGTFGEFNIAGSPPTAFELDARVIKPTGDNVNSLAPDVFALDYLYNSADPTITGGCF